jgi:hypothetical protein
MVDAILTYPHALTLDDAHKFARVRCQYPPSRQYNRKRVVGAQPEKRGREWYWLLETAFRPDPKGNP